MCHREYMETLRIGRPPQLSARARLRRAAREIGLRMLPGVVYVVVLVALLMVGGVQIG